MQIVKTFKLVQINGLYQNKFELPFILRTLGHLKFKIDALLTFDSKETEQCLEDDEFTSIIQKYISAQIIRISNNKVITYPYQKKILFNDIQPFFLLSVNCLFLYPKNFSSHIIISQYAPKSSQTGLYNQKIEQFLTKKNENFLLINGDDGVREIGQYKNIKSFRNGKGRILVVDFNGENAIWSGTYAYKEGDLEGFQL